MLLPTKKWCLNGARSRVSRMPLPWQQTDGHGAKLDMRRYKQTFRTHTEPCGRKTCLAMESQ